MAHGSGRRVTVLAYHDPDPATFARHLARLTALYSVIPLETFLAARRASDLRSLPPRALVITLDDGWAGNFGLPPALKRHGVRPTIFLSTSTVGTGRHFWWTHAPDQTDQEGLKRLSETERLAELALSGFAADLEYPDRQALSVRELAEMAPWVDFQSHSRTHPILPRCTDDVAASKIVGSAEDVERLTGIPPRAFAYPNGDFSERDVDLVRRAGYECGLTIEPGYNDARTDPYRLKRIFIDDDASLTELDVCASGVYGILMRLLPGLFGKR
jgi:peptidoglycan/xylan/chitin deacetylase (PgdA/CDA1 family)